MKQYLKNTCFKCGVKQKQGIDLISFFMIDDWIQFEIKVCQSCITLAHQTVKEASEDDWKCPICQAIYSCTICGEKHATADCKFTIQEEKDGGIAEEIINIARIVGSRITKCAVCKSTNLIKDTKRIECGGCGWIHTINGGIAK